MLYLFNSGARSLYQSNALRTLMLQPGLQNEYRYTCIGPRVNIDSSRTLAQWQAETDVILSFIDRYTPGQYTYIPLRKGKLVGVRREQDRLYFKVELLEFVFPRDISAASTLLSKRLSPLQLASLTNGNPDEKNDGHYAIVHQDSPTDLALNIDEEAWVAAAEYLAKSTAFATRDPVFYKFKLRSGSNDVKPTKGKYQLTFGNSYDLEVSYRYPGFNNSVQKTISLRASDNLRVLSDNVLPIEANSDRVTYAIKPKSFSDDTAAYFSLDVTSGAALKNATVDLVNGRSFVFKIGLVLLIYALATTYLTTDLTKITPTPTTLQEWMLALLPKFLVSVLQVFTLYIIFRMVGKKPL
jgi:hypothetical protein